MRELAQRSAKAAKEIKALISTSGTHVQTGVSLVGETGKALDAIVAEVQEINQHVHAIAEASREQSIGLQEINTAVNSMDQGTQQNAAMVEESTAASHNLATEAAALNNLLGQFRLTGTGGFTASAPIAPSHTAAPRAAARPAARAAPIRVAREGTARPAASPARALGQKIANAFGAGGQHVAEPGSRLDGILSRSKQASARAAAAALSIWGPDPAASRSRPGCCRAPCNKTASRRAWRQADPTGWHPRQQARHGPHRHPPFRAK